jgi:hypothetical protein
VCAGFPARHGFGTLAAAEIADLAGDRFQDVTARSLLFFAATMASSDPASRLAEIRTSA